MLPSCPPAAGAILALQRGHELSERLCCWPSFLSPGGYYLHTHPLPCSRAPGSPGGAPRHSAAPPLLWLVCVVPLRRCPLTPGSGGQEAGSWVSRDWNSAAVLGQLPPPGPCTDLALAEKELFGCPGALGGGERAELRPGTQPWSLPSASRRLACMSQAGAYTRPGAPVLQLLPGHTAWLWWPVGLMLPGLTVLPPRREF